MTYRRWLPVLGVVGAAFVVWILGGADVVTLENLRAHFKELQAYVAAKPVEAGVVYVVAYISIAVLALPVAVWMTVAGGALFGVAWGFVLKFMGAVVGATLVFWLARGSVGVWMAERFPDKVAAIKRRLDGHMFTSLLVLRIVPLFPFFLVNIVPALVHMRTRDYVLATMLGITPGGFVYTLAGVGLAEALAAGGPVTLGRVFTPTMVAAMAGMVLLAVAPKVWGWWKASKG